MRAVGKILEITGNRQSRTVYASFPDRTSGEGFFRRNEPEEQFFAIILEKVPDAQAFCILVGCSCYLAHIDISKNDCHSSKSSPKYFSRVSGSESKKEESP